MIVLDASVAAKLFIAESDSDQAEAVFMRDESLIAPDLIVVEVANALYKSWKRGIIDSAHMDRAISSLPRLFSRLHPTLELIADAVIMSRILRHPVPDCVYAALSWKTGARIVTADLRFIEAAQAVPAWSQISVHMKEFGAR